MTQDNKPTETKEENKKPQDNTGVMMTGHIKISDPETGEVIVDKRNAIHYENMSQALANSLANKTTGFVHEIAPCGGPWSRAAASGLELDDSERQSTRRGLWF